MAQPAFPRATEDREFVALIAIGLPLAALAAVLVAAGESILILAIPAALPAGMLCMRWPVPAVGILVLCTSAYGSLHALTPAPALKLADALLVSLWLGVVIGYIRGGRHRPTYPSPGLLMLIAYIAISALAVISASSPSSGFASFRLTASHLSVVALLALAPWGARTYRGLGKAVLVVTAGVAAYCVFRYLTGSAVGETALARATQSGLPQSTELRFFGSFPTAQELTVWAAGMLPFALALLLAWRGRWRWVAGVAIGLCLVALLASDVRTGLFAAGAGLVVTTVLFLGSQGFSSGARVGAGFTSVLLVAALATTAYVTTISGSPTREDRFLALLNPSEDRNYQIRAQRWEFAWEEIKRKPFGHGLGSAGTGSRSEDVLPVGPTVLDSSYLKVGLEQGIAVMVFFGLMLLALLISLSWRSIVEPSSANAAYTIGAAGTLTALMVLFYGSSYVESPSIIPAWVSVGLGMAVVAGAQSETKPRQEFSRRPTRSPA